MKFTPSEDYGGLLKQARALHLLISSLQEQVKFYSEKDYTLNEKRLDKLEKSLESEKDMNAQLTKELIKLQEN